VDSDKKFKSSIVPTTRNGEDGFLVTHGEDINLSDMLYVRNQLPSNWIFRGIRHKQDALIIYGVHEKHRDFITNKVEEAFGEHTSVPREIFINEFEKVLDKHSDIFLPDFNNFYYLMHLSIENIFKAIWLDINVDVLGFLELPKKIKTHNLIFLLNEIKIKASKEEIGFLKKITDLSQGYGRYPIEIKSDKINKWNVGDRGFESVCVDCINNAYKEDKELYETFFSKYISNRIIDVNSRHDKHLLKIYNAGG